MVLVSSVKIFVVGWKICAEVYFCRIIAHCGFNHCSGSHNLQASLQEKNTDLSPGPPTRNLNLNWQSVVLRGASNLVES